MDIYTGYYAQMKKYTAAGLVPVSIAYLTPVWYHGEVCFEIAPKRELLKGYKAGTTTQEEYAKQYLNFLSTVHWSEVIDKFYDISERNDDKDLVLCCYEKPADFCHRHILAKYLTEKGLTVNEYFIRKPITK